jgi:HNH endonuclease
MNGKNLWQFNDRFYWDTDGLDGSQVYALLFTRNARQKQNIERAQAITAMGMLPQQQTRAGIPDDLKLLVWQRDGGQCRSCCGRVELQYDHIIPVAMGGATSAENLQILCGPATGARARA